MGQRPVSDAIPDDVLAFWFPPGLDALVPDDHIGLLAQPDAGRYGRRDHRAMD